MKKGPTIPGTLPSVPSRRSAMLVGSLPFDTEETCMNNALETLGPALFSLPDGEIGEKTPAFPKGNRIAWVVYAIEKLTEDSRMCWGTTVFLPKLSNFSAAARAAQLA